MTESHWTVPGRAVAVRLDEPPKVAALGVGVHGTASDVDVFRLPGLWQLHLYRYTAELTVDGAVHTIRPGHVGLVPPGAVVRYRYRGRSEHLYVHLDLPGTGEVREVPVLQDAGALTPVLSELLQGAIAIAPRSPRRADAEVWGALWRVAELAEPVVGAPRPHASAAAAIAYIESNLAGRLTVTDVARAARVSHNHLIRLLRAETGGTVVGYIRRRRMERARHLLCESTLSIPAIAAAVGVADLQAFNKACRRELGASPRAIRAGG
ncbi:helix-turn-helix transcriptional regulator [Streptomyces sp. NBC_01619]|uniref:Helix-turn-helix transcriptional regulator n=1 Tax=Streptomyces pratisoli TaxID=3139917 RepID=A0ACC6QSR8_9ACTN|nr:helix-turn-helix transcriptional regulator [Streptomyces sp. NBC_01619]MCX4513988.1 helix-turn-helix transcriptional regulator [Streptomyces sp. NBC_01619]